MSMMFCNGCDRLIDTDDDPECFVGEYQPGVYRKPVLCEHCRDDDDNIDPDALGPCMPMAVERGCSCRMETVHSASIDPPEPVRDEWCPLHGRDPDAEYESRRDDLNDAWARGDAAEDFA